MTKYCATAVSPSRERSRCQKLTVNGHVHGCVAFHGSGEAPVGLVAGVVEDASAHPPPESERDGNDHHGSADEFGQGELPAHHHGQDDAQLDDEVGGGDFKGHRRGEMRALAEQGPRQGHRGVGARRGRRPKARCGSQGPGRIIGHQRRDPLPADESLNDA
nr:hypothetical protein [Arthrobacter sp. SRS-W-1-2016]